MKLKIISLLTIISTLNIMPVLALPEDIGNKESLIVIGEKDIAEFCKSGGGTWNTETSQCNCPQQFSWNDSTNKCETTKEQKQSLPENFDFKNIRGTFIDDMASKREALQKANRLTGGKLF